MQHIKHLLTGEELSIEEIESLLALAHELKIERSAGKERLNKQIALVFDKPSLRTRFSFTIAASELGAHVVESLGQTRKFEEPEDLMRVLQGYCHALVIRTHSDDALARMQKVATIPIINSLSELHHPCQILADLLTLKEVFGTLKGLKLTYIGDGNNILHSLLLLAPQMGIDLTYCCPPTHQPNTVITERALKRMKTGSITACSLPEAAANRAHAVYTDVWTSMGFEDKTDESAFVGFQVNEALMKKALPEAVFMHCMPMVRGKEVSHTLPDSEASVIFKQSENRLHIQKALLIERMI